MLTWVFSCNTKTFISLLFVQTIVQLSVSVAFTLHHHVVLCKLLGVLIVIVKTKYIFTGATAMDTELNVRRLVYHTDVYVQLKAIRKATM